MLNNSNNKNTNSHQQYSTTEVEIEGVTSHMSPNLIGDNQQQQQQQQLTQVSLQQQSPNIINIKNKSISLNQQLKLLEVPIINATRNQGTTHTPQKIIFQNTTPQILHHTQPPQQQQQQQQIIVNNQNIPILLQNTFNNNGNSSSSSTSNSNTNTNQIYLNLNNRIVPIQTLNISTQIKQQQPQQQQQQQQTVKLVLPNTITQQSHKQLNDSNLNRILVTTTTPNSNSVTSNVNNNSFVVLQSLPNVQNVLTNSTLQQQQQQQQHQKITFINNNSNNNSSLCDHNQSQDTHRSSSSTTSLGAEIAEKMKLLENIQTQLRSFQQKISSIPNVDHTQKIQQALTQQEQIALKTLLQKRTEVQSEIQLLKQKIMSPAAVVSSSSDTDHSTTQQPPTQNIQVIKSLNDLTLTDKLKVLRNIQVQIQQIKEKDGSLLVSDNKQKFQILVQKQNELQALIIQEQHQQPNTQSNSSNTNNKSINYILSRQANGDSNRIFTVTSSGSTSGTNLSTSNHRSNVIISPIVHKTLSGSNIKIKNVPIITNTTTTTSSNGSTQSVQKIKNIVSATTTATTNHLNAQKSTSNNGYRVLNNADLVQNGIVNKNTEDAILKQLKILDDKLCEMPLEKQQAFVKNQSKLVNKYLEQYHPKYSIKNSIRNQLQRDQELACNPDYKTPFSDKSDAIKRLSRYHTFQHIGYEPSEEEFLKFDECFLKVSERLVRTADAMKKRFHLLTLGQMQRNIKASEETFLLKLFVDDLKKDFEEEKSNKEKLQQELLNPKRHVTSDEENDEDEFNKTHINESNLIKRIKYEFNNFIEMNEAIKEEKLCVDDDEKETHTRLKPSPPSTQAPPVKLKIKLIKPETTNESQQQTYKVTQNFYDENAYNTENDETQMSSSQNYDYDEEGDAEEEDEDDEQVNESTTNQNSSSCFLNETNSHQQNTNTNDNLFGADDNMNLSCLDDFILNEDELAVQSILDI